MYRIGIDLGGTNIAAGLVDENGTLIHKDSTPTNKNAKDTEIVYNMWELVSKIINDNNLQGNDIKSIGIGCPGSFDAEKGVIMLTVNLPFRQTPVREVFAKHTSIPVYLNNDGNCAALGEFIAGGAKNYKNSLTFTLGTGVGGGIIIDGKIYNGFNFAAGELGHMVIRVDGEPCTCGRLGCFESYASASALIRETVKSLKENKSPVIAELCDEDPAKINAKTAFDAKRMGDPEGTRIVDEYIKNLGEGLINYINIFQPEIILIGGGVSKEGEYLLEPLRNYINKFVYGSGLLDHTKIEIALLGNDAGIIGAAMLDS